MEVKLGAKRFDFNPLRLILLLVCLYIFYLNCPYWYEKLQILTTNEKNIDWIPKEVMDNNSVWGDTLSPDHDILIIPYGNENFTVNYSTDIYSMSGYWSAIPKVNFSEDNNFSYKIKTIDPIQVNQLAGSTNKTRRVMPYLKFSIDSSKELSHKVVIVNTELELEYPQKKELSFNFEYTKSSIKRDFRLFFVAPDEYPSIKKLLMNDVPEMAITIYIRGFISVVLLVLIFLNSRLVFKKVVD